MSQFISMLLEIYFYTVGNLFLYCWKFISILLEIYFYTVRNCFSSK
jgi:hypothetical protein